MPTAPKTAATLSRWMGVLAALAPALAWAADAPVPHKGDTAWMLTSTAFVLLMSVPGLALFYGGLVRTKVCLVFAWTAVVAFIAFYIVKRLVGLRVPKEEEREGLDITSHGERAYDL
jgi:Amt family ammonium transporter